MSQFSTTVDYYVVVFGDIPCFVSTSKSQLYEAIDVLYVAHINEGDEKQISIKKLRGTKEELLRTTNRVFDIQNENRNRIIVAQRRKNFKLIEGGNVIH